MNFTDIFIRKPVLAIVVSALILVLGLRALTALQVRQYPQTQNAVVTITTAYYGADAQTIAGFITQPLEQAIAQAQGIDYLSSSSTSGVSTITATLRLNYDANRALTEIQTRSPRCAISCRLRRSSRCSTSRSGRAWTPCIWGSAATCCLPTASPITSRAW